MIEWFIGSMANAKPLPPVEGPLVVHLPGPADAGTAVLATSAISIPTTQRRSQRPRALTR